MTNPKIDNAIANDRVILWQYDQAPNLIGLIRKWNEFATISVTDFWDYYRDVVINIDNADDFALNVWGNFLNTPWPSIRIPASDSTEYRKIERELYRRLLKAKLYLMWRPSTVSSFNTYLSFLFPGDEALEKQDGVVQMYKPRCKVLDFQDMSMSYTFPSDATEDEAYLVFQHYEMVFPFPAGIRYAGGFSNKDRVLGFDGQGLKNMAYNENVMVWADETVDGEDGGIISGTDKANYKVPPVVKGKAFIVSSESAPRPTVSGLIAGKRYWIDFGDGNPVYIDASAGSTSYQKATAYAETGSYAVCVYGDDPSRGMSVAGAESTYLL